MAISNLINNIAGSVRGLGTALGLISVQPDPRYVPFSAQGIDPIDSGTKERWFNFASELYVFGVIDDGDDLNADSPGARALKTVTSFFSSAGVGGGDSNSASNSFSDFALPLTPQEIQQVENFAVSIQPTQGGTSVHHSGNRYKELVISGTTGVHPFRGTGGVNAITGAAIFAPDEIKYRSGYEVFIHFRNWIKSYHQFKAIGSQTHKARMIFKNFKDWEFLVVEPLKFTMKRDASRPLLYNYTVSFRVLGHYSLPKPNSNFLDTIDSGLAIARTSLETARGVFLRSQDIARSVAKEIDRVTENLRIVALGAKALQGIPTTVADLSAGSAAKFFSARDAAATSLGLVDAIKKEDPSNPDLPPDASSLADEIKSKLDNGADPITTLDNFLKQMGTGAKIASVKILPTAAQNNLVLEQQNAALLSREEIERIRNDLKNLKDKLELSLGFEDETYSDIYNLTQTTSLEDGQQITDEQFELLYATQEALKGMDAILSNDEYFDTAQELYSRADSTSGAGTIGQNIFSFPDPAEGFREIVLPQGVTLEDIAFFELGDASRWTEIAELNGLKAPYIEDVQNESTRINYRVLSFGFWDTADLQLLTPSDLYLVPSSPTPANGWAGKANYIAEYLGGDKNQSSSWRFIYPEGGTIIEILDRQEYVQFEAELGAWAEIDLDMSVNPEVARPGDVIKIPGNPNPQTTTFTRGPRDNVVTNGLSASERALAVDLKLTETGDIDVTPSGDLNLSFGADNAAQAIVLKLLFEPGSLKKHPEIGSVLRLGGKIPNLAGIRSQIATSLLQDERIQDVKNINIRQQNSTVEINFDVIFRNIPEPVSITIPV